MAITSVPEDQTDRIPPESFFPSVMTADVEQHGWLVTHFANDT
jgi:hypothetical protein